MVTKSKSINVLIAEDNEIDRLMAQEAIEQIGSDDKIHFVEDGEELLDYLLHQGAYTDKSKSPRPDLLILDLKLPKKDGYEALKDIKADPELRQIPITIMTASSNPLDRINAYNIGAQCFITKPDSMEALVGLMRSMTWWVDRR